MPITYDVANNIITVTGYTESVPCNFTDLWNADKGGTLQLLAPTAAGMDLSLTRQVRPTDKVSLKLNIVITNFSVAGTVTLTGKDKDDGAQTEDISITGNGTYTTARWWKSIDAGGVDCTGTYTIEIRQSQWGVVWKTGTTQFTFDCKLQIGDGSTSTYFKDIDKQIVFSPTVTDNIVLVKANANFQLGNLIDASQKLSKEGCSMSFLHTSVESNIYGETNAVVNIYSSHFFAYWYQTIKILTGGRVWNSIVSKYTYIRNCPNIDVYNVVFIQSKLAIHSSGGTFNRIFVMSAGESYEIAVGTTTSITVKNLLVRKVGYIAQTWTTQPSYLVNADSDNWNFKWNAAGTFYRQYEFDLKVVDKLGNPINGATVTLYDKDGNQVFQQTTGADGKIATQTVTYCYYDQAHGDTPVMYSPFMLKVQRLDTPPYIDETLKGIPLDEKTKLRLDPKGFTGIIASKIEDLERKMKIELMEE